MVCFGVHTWVFFNIFKATEAAPLNSGKGASVAASFTKDKIRGGLFSEASLQLVPLAPGRSILGPEGLSLSCGAIAVVRTREVDCAVVRRRSLGR